MFRIFKKLFSMPVGLALLLLFALSCSVATFIENDFGTQSAFALIYTSWWFALIQLWLVVLIIYNMFAYKLFRKDKLPALIFHFSFLFILLGAGFTRYFGFEGLMHIREGKSENLLSSSASFVQMMTKKDGKTYRASKSKYFSFVGGNSYELDLHVDDKKAKFTYLDIIPNAKKSIVEDKSQNAIISLMVSSPNLAAREITLRQGELKQVGDIVFGFDKDMKLDDGLHSFNVSLENGKFYFYSNSEISWYKMSDSSKGSYKKDTKTLFEKKQLYTLHRINIVPKALLEHGKQTWVRADEGLKSSGLKALLGLVSYEGKSKEVALINTPSGEGMPSDVEIAGQVFSLKWGTKIYELPFSLELIDFQLERYAGSRSPSSYASEVKVLDKKNNIAKPYRIYMNHVLDYQGFRFFQSSYDRDEKGTILSVNKDPGKVPTYFGYFLLFLGLILNIINPKSRFRKLANDINKNSLSRFAGLLLFAFAFLHVDSLNATHLPVYDKDHASRFGTILTQSVDGRIKPVDTIAHEVLSKVAKSSKFQGQNANQILLGMIINPNLWQTIPVIKVHHPKVKELLGIDKHAKYASFDDFFKKDGEKEYKLIKQIENAKRKKASQLSQFEKDLIKVDERLNICYMVYTGDILKIFPFVEDKNKKWFSPNTALMYFPKEQGQSIQNILGDYFEGVQHGLKSGDWTKANEGVDKIKTYQVQYANALIPSPSRVKAEIYFNKFQIFFKLFPVYLLLGFALLFSIFFKILFPSINLARVKTFVFVAYMFAFGAHTVGLGMRWYISAHPPWSDGYESMVYIAWALALAGILFSKKSPISLALTAILSGISLFVAHLSWMDPQITNLVPVLKSYWLSIHVSVITASYGFLGLCALLGFFTLILFILRNPKKNDARNLEIDKNIVEATKINEMSMILGLSLLTIGNFLGGIWANESWGRYWGWDAKETWALISILIYAAVVHIRFVPKLNSQYFFALFSSFAYWSIIMTYFGVNFYLSGMHSYAAGDPVPIPTFVPITAFVMAVVAIAAFFKRNIGSKL